MRELAIIEAPSALGLRPSGVQDLLSALIDAGLLDHPGAVRAGRVEAPPYDPRRDAATGVLNPVGIAEYSVRLADAVGGALDTGRFPVVLTTSTRTCRAWRSSDCRTRWWAGRSATPGSGSPEPSW